MSQQLDDEPDADEVEAALDEIEKEEHISKGNLLERIRSTKENFKEFKQPVPTNILKVYNTFQKEKF